MKILQNFIGLLFLTLIVSIPFSVFAETVDSDMSTIGTVDVSADTSKNISKLSISGTAIDTKTLKINIYKEGSTKIIYKSSTIKVKKEVWSKKITKKLSDGTYEIKVYGSKGVVRDLIATSTFSIDTHNKDTVSKKSNTTLIVESVPLLSGGVVRAKGTVPVSYLQVTNIGKDSSVVKGFWVKQNGSASVQSIIGLTTIDDSGMLKNSTGGKEGSTPFKDNLAFAPVSNVILAPGQMKLFTIKAIMSEKVSSYIGKNIMIDVTSIEANSLTKNKFPIRGTTWTIAQ